CIELVAKAPQAVVIVSRQRFFEPTHVHPLELASYLQGLRKTPRAMSAMTGLNASLVGIYHDLDPVTDGRAHRFDNLEVLPWIGKVKPKLHRPVAFVDHATYIFDAP